MWICEDKQSKKIFQSFWQGQNLGIGLLSAWEGANQLWEHGYYSESVVGQLTFRECFFYKSTAYLLNDFQTEKSVTDGLCS